MKAVYVKDNNILKYFIFGINDENDCEEYHFKDIEVIKNNSFQNPWNLRRIFFDENLRIIEKEAFKNCEELEVLCCCEIEDDNFSGRENRKRKATANVSKNEKSIVGINCSSLLAGDFLIQTLAFDGCSELHTIILPEMSKPSKLIIEKKAFKGCKSLRTVVAFVDDVSFTENPFEDCPKELTFVCYKDSEVERFARENGYGVIYA